MHPDFAARDCKVVYLPQHYVDTGVVPTPIRMDLNVRGFPDMHRAAHREDSDL